MHLIMFGEFVQNVEEKIEKTQFKKTGKLKICARFCGIRTSSLRPKATRFINRSLAFLIGRDVKKSETGIW